MGRMKEYWRQVTGAQPVARAAAASGAEPTGPLPGEEGTSLPAAASPGDDTRRRLESYGLSHVGKVRAGNEDHFVIASLQRSLEVRQTNLDDPGVLTPLCGPKAYLFAVADGVGGGAAGQMASGITLRTIVEYLSETIGSYHAVPPIEEQAFLEPLRQAVQRAHDRLLATFGPQRGDGPATTLTLALIVWPHAYLVHVGDSRAYHLRAGRLQRMTRDQTMGAYLVDQHGISEQQAEQGGFNNVLASAVGATDLTPVVSAFELAPDDVLLLCTDGLTRHVDEERIAEVLGRAADPEAGCRELVALALEGGGRDNVTVVVAHTLAG